MDSSHANEEVLRAVIKCCSDEVCSVLERDKPMCPRSAHAASFSIATPAVPSVSGGVGVMLSQHQQCPDTRDAIIWRLVDILARAEIVPIEKRQQFAEALYDNGISNERKLKDSVMGDNPDVDLVSEIGMKKSQKRDLISFLAASQP